MDSKYTVTARFLAYQVRQIQVTDQGMALRIDLESGLDRGEALQVVLPFQDAAQLIRAMRDVADHLQQAVDGESPRPQH